MNQASDLPTPVESLAQILKKVDERIECLEPIVQAHQPQVLPRESIPIDPDRVRFQEATWLAIKLNFTFVLGQALGSLFGAAAAGPPGGYVGLILGGAILPPTCLARGPFGSRCLGGAFVGATAAAMGLAQGTIAATLTGACAGLLVSLCGAGDFPSTSKAHPFLVRMAVWMALGAVAGNVGAP